jgi:hypothetical protein
MGDIVCDICGGAQRCECCKYCGPPPCDCDVTIDDETTTSSGVRKSIADSIWGWEEEMNHRLKYEWITPPTTLGERAQMAAYKSVSGLFRRR